MESRDGLYRTAGNFYLVAQVTDEWPHVPFCLGTASPTRHLAPLTPDDASVGTTSANVVWYGKHYDPRLVILESIRYGVSYPLTGLPAFQLAGTLLALAHPRAFVQAHCGRCVDVPAAQAIARAICQVEDKRSAKGFAEPFIAGVLLVARVTGVDLLLPESTITAARLARCHRAGVRVVPVDNRDHLHCPPDWKLPAFLREG